MMKKQIAGVVFAASIVAGVGAGVLANAITSDDPATAATATPSGTTTPPTATPTPSPAPSTSTDPKGSGGPIVPMSDLGLNDGSVGRVTVGMSKDDALATGLFEPGVSPVEGCPAPPLAWKRPYAKTFDVQTLGNGEISSIGVLKAGPRTADGLEVGSTYGEVRRVLGEAAPVEAGYGQAGMFDFDDEDGGWIGFLFNSTVDDLKDSDTVSFIEITKGTQPGLMRDGC